ncbi:MAG: hypothetical protein GY940_23730, partial [bacterium]|nr:hypothetical protein [bacterium]
LNNPVMSKFLKQSNVQVSPNTFFPILMKHLIERTVEHFRPPVGNKINMALILPRMEEKVKHVAARLKEIYKNTLRQENRGLKGELVIDDFFSLKVTDRFLHYVVPEKNIKIHTLIELCNGMIPPNIMEVTKAGNLLVYNGPITRIMSNKLNLALLSQHEDDPGIFTPGERETIKKYISWTRKVIPGETTYIGEKIRLEEFIPSNQEHLVLKQSVGFGGQQVYVGRHTPPTAWKQVLEKALREKNWVIQEYIKSSPYLHQVGQRGCASHQVVWGFFVFGSRYAGGSV